ncbi:MAG TPA: hypothetical protein DEF79_02415 [Gammaproteobacteria bacterium]|nr:hypothetical protein [Gammaproteobacteria bacterium]
MTSVSGNHTLDWFGSLRISRHVDGHQGLIRKRRSAIFLLQNKRRLVALTSALMGLYVLT